jgi:YfiH family protein
MNILKFSHFSTIPNLIAGFSTREFGSMRPADPTSEESRKIFLSALSIPTDQTIRMHQIHSNTIHWVTQQDRNTIQDQTDGLLTKDKNTFLIVMVGDCVPLLFFDKKKEYSGVAHAGWRGVLGNIAQNSVQQMVEAGSKPEDILVGIGPCIRSCCYQVDLARIEQFKKKYPKTEYIRSGNYLDLPKLIIQQLQNGGIPTENIEDTKICTADNLDRFYSYRKEGEKFGEFIGVIGIRQSTPIKVI